MNEEIKVALKNKKIAFFKWKINGRPKETDNLYLKNKKQTTHALRKECRLEVAKRRLCERQKLVDARTADRKMFHKIIKNQRGKLSKFIDQLNVDDEIFYNEDIIEGWSTHFHQLAKKIPNPNYDNEYLELIENEAKIIIDICKQRFKHCPITNKEMEKAISDLNRNKAVDYFGINAENIIHGGKQLQQYLQLLFDKSFEFGCISDILKIGILFPVYKKNKGDIKSAKNYRGITVTPTYSKLIEKIIKIRENPVILKNQNPLQRGFTENTTPLLCELMIEEFERESKDLKLPTYIALLDGKSAFDVVVHSNLIRRLYQAGISDQSIILIDSLYKNATSCVKWRNNTSQIFEIEQGVRQGGAISADLYKLYVNPLLNILSGTGLGGHIGDIGCCAPTCADDVAIISNNPMELQMLIDIAANFSKREGYTLQPTKSVVIPISTSTKSIEIDENYWNINKNPMPVVEHSTHIGIQKCQKNSAKLTAEENMKKARRSLYSLMGTGLHGKNGLDPGTAITILYTYVMPILTYGLEILLPSGRILDSIHQFHKKMIKQILSLAKNTADPAVYILSGSLPMEAELHLKALSLYGNITRADRSTIEWRLAERQLHLKTNQSNSWFIQIKKICLKYDILDCQDFLNNPLGKLQWKSLITKKIHTYWNDKINKESEKYSSLKYISGEYMAKRIHPILTTNTSNCRDIIKLPIRTRFATGNYILQTNRAKFNQNDVSAVCRVCGKEDETISHFLISCTPLETERMSLLKSLREQYIKVLELLNINMHDIDVDFIHVIINPYHLVNYCGTSLTSELCAFINIHIEPACRTLIYKLHLHRYKLLNLDQKRSRKNNLRS
ncbi:unnamed protein product [Mytilus edulis]|uniref:Reverse transcriptase domain-containing protein n=1 Tax=Mytilus edulis TaxID=6550 RepID=A0A8S3R024_MYTED|nr:unnamed protein product [Mytilus edulis]